MLHNFLSMGTRGIGIGLALISVSGLVASVTAAEKTLLRYRFQPGQVVRYSVQLRDDYFVQIGETSERPYTSQASIKNYRVLSVDSNGVAEIEITLLEQVRAETHQGGDTFKFDSTQPGQNVPTLFLPMQAIVGVPHLRLKVSPTGVTSDPVPLSGLPLPESGPEAALDVLLRLPEQPVEVGERWAEEFQVPVNVSRELKKQVRMQRQYHLTSLEGDIATIVVTTKSLTPLNVPEEEVQLLLRTPTVTVKLDLRQGLIVSRSLKLEKQVVGLENGRGTVSVRQEHLERLIPARQASAKP